MKKSVKKSAPKSTPKATAKTLRHPLSGWIVFDVVRQHDYEIDFVIDGVAMVTTGDTFHLAIPLAEMRSGDTGTQHKLFSTLKAFEIFMAANYPDRVKP